MRLSPYLLLLPSMACTIQPEKSGEDPAPLEFSVYPPASGRGTQVEVDIDANRSAFSYSNTNIDFGENVTVLNISVDDGYSARADILIDPDAELGLRDVIVWTDGSDYTVGESFTIVDQSFLIEPTSGKIGECIDVGILGNNTEWRGGLTWPHFGDGIEILDFTVYSDTLAEANISITSDAFPGWRNVVVDSGTGDYTVMYDSFQVDRIGLAASWEPVSAAQGRTVEFTIRAKATDFLSSIPHIRFFDRFGENPDILIRDLFILDAENMYGRMQLSNAAALGTRDVLIDTSEDSVRISDAFEVTSLNWSLSQVAISLEFEVVRWTDEETCEFEERVDASAVFFIPLNPPCGSSGMGPPQPSPRPYDNNGVFEIVEGVSGPEEDCPFPTTISAGDYVWFESPENIVTMEKVYEPSTGRIYYKGFDLTMNDYVPNQMYDLHTQGDPDGIGEYLLEGVQPTVPADWYWLSPDMCGLIWDREDGFPFEWTPAQTYPKAIFGTFIYGTLVENGNRAFAGVLPWDDGVHSFTALEMLQLNPEEVRLEVLSYIKGPYFGLPESIYQYCRSDSYIAYIANFILE